MNKLLLILSLLLCRPGYAQVGADFTLKLTIPTFASDFAVDNLGNLFLFTPEGQLKKLDASGDSIAVFNNVKKYGKLYSVDVSNPLKVLLYYKDYGTVVVLDRLLNQRNSLDLRKLNLFQVRAIGQAYDNGIWVFDELEGKIKHISDDNRVVDQSTDFRQLFDSMPSPRYIVDQNKTLYLYDPDKGVYLFDYYGTFKSRIPFLGWQEFTVINSILFGRDSASLYRYQPGSLDLKVFRIPPYLAKAKRIEITPAGLYALFDNRVEVYAYRR